MAGRTGRRAYRYTLQPYLWPTWRTWIRRILGVLSLAKKFGTAAVEDACAAALEMGAHEYRFVRRYLERDPQLTLRQGGIAAVLETPLHPAQAEAMPAIDSSPAWSRTN